MGARPGKPHDHDLIAADLPLVRAVWRLRQFDWHQLLRQPIEQGRGRFTLCTETVVLAAATLNPKVQDELHRLGNVGRDERLELEVGKWLKGGA